MVRATYYDGSSAAAHDVELSVDSHHLSIRLADGQVLANWPLDRIFTVKANYKSQPLRLGCHDDGEARLVVEHPEAVAYLKGYLPKKLFAQSSIVKTLGLAVAYGAITVAFLAGVYYSIPLLAEPIAQRIPVETEKQIGATVAEDVFRQWPECVATPDTAEDGRTALDDLTHLLTEGTPLEGEVSVTLVKAGMVNAFALPGGYVVVTGELLHAISGPDELAAVLAHEFGHVEYRHSMVALTRYMGTSFIVQLITGGGGGSSQWILIAGSELANVSYSREFEREADEYAIERLNATGIGTQGMTAFFDRLAAQEEIEDDRVRTVQSFIRTHPFSDERADAARDAVGGKTRPVMSAEEWRALKSLCPETGIEDGATRTGPMEPQSE